MSSRTPLKLVVAAAVAALIAIAAGCGTASEIQSVPAGSQIVDVRTPAEFAAWHFPGAINIPVGDLAHRLQELAPDKEIIVYCRSGSRASVAKKVLLANGFTRVKNGGGLHDMRKFLDQTQMAAQK